MSRWTGWQQAAGTVRQPVVAGSFYPAQPVPLRARVRALLDMADRLAEADAGRLASAGAGVPDTVGLLVPHAGLEYSGVVAAAGWRRLRRPAPTRIATRTEGDPRSVVLLGTNHGAGWLHGVGAWGRGAWRTPLGDVAVDEELTAAIVGLGPPYLEDRAAHLAEHSIEVQLPILAALEPDARIVPLAVSCGTGPDAVDAGTRLGRLLADWPGPGRVVIAISSDMAHYPDDADCRRATIELLDPILAADPLGLAEREEALTRSRMPGLACGMCGVQAAVLGLAALRAFGVTRGIQLAAATSADAGGSPDRAVGYLSVAFVAG